MDAESETLIPSGGGFDVAPTLRAGGNRTGGDRPPGTDVDTADSLIVTHSLRGEGHDASEDGTGRGVPITLAIRGRGDSHDLECRQDGTANAILTPNGGRAGIGVGAVAFQQNSRSEVRSLGDKTGAVTSGPGAQCQNYLKQGMQVRRLTPLECERLQGFPDGYTQVPYRGKPAADGPRYKALGNSMAVNCMRWIGYRIAAVENL